VRPQSRRFATAAVLTTLLAVSAAHAQVADGGAPSDAAAATATVDAALPATDGGAPTPAAKAPPPTADQIATMMLATAPPIDAEPTRPITRRLWFWLAVTGAVVAGVLVGVAVRNPNHTRPDCPPDYVCPP
jgi:hypothetical protein